MGKEKDLIEVKHSSKIRKIESKKVNLSKNSDSLLRKVATVNPKKEYQTKSSILSSNAETSEDLFAKPFHEGWKREIVNRNVSITKNRQSDIYYHTPDGKKMRSMPMVSTYLSTTKTKLELKNFTFSKRRVFREPHEIERDALPQKGFSSSSIISKQKKVQKPKKKELPLKIKIEKNTIESSLDKKPSTTQSLGVRKSRRSIVIKNMAGNIDDDIKQLDTLSQSAEQNGNLLKNSSTIIKTEPFPFISVEDKKSEVDKEKPVKTNEISIKDKNQKKVSKDDVKSVVTSANPKTDKDVHIDYMNQVDQLVASEMSYEDKLAAVRRLAKNSHTGTSNQNKVLKEVVKIGVEEVGNVFKESDVYAGSECSLYSDDDECNAFKDAIIDGLDKRGVVENFEIKDKTIHLAKRKNKQGDGKIQKDGLDTKRQKLDDINLKVDEKEKRKNSRLGRRERSKKLISSGVKEETNNTNRVCAKECGLPDLPTIHCSSCMYLFHKECIHETGDGNVSSSLCAACEKFIKDNRVSHIPSISGSITQDENASESKDNITEGMQSGENELETNMKNDNERFEDEMEFQMLVIDKLIMSRIDLKKSFLLKVEDKSILVESSQVSLSMNRVTLQLPNKTLPDPYIKYNKVLLKFKVSECDGMKTLSVFLR